MRGAFLTIVVAAAVSGCAQQQQQTYQQSIASLQAQREQIRENQHKLAMESYIQWTQEAPITCASPTLPKARDTVLFVASITDPKTQGFDSAIAAGSWALDVADGVKAHGCGAVAKDIYTKVISIYIGSGYSGLRDRAMVGLSDLK